MDCICGHNKDEHYFLGPHTATGCMHHNKQNYCGCMEYRTNEYHPDEEPRLTVTIILKDGMEKSDYAKDVGYGDKEIYIDWADGTTTYAKVKTIETLLVTA